MALVEPELSIVAWVSLNQNQRHQEIAYLVSEIDDKASSMDRAFCARVGTNAYRPLRIGLIDSTYSDKTVVARPSNDLVLVLFGEAAEAVVVDVKLRTLDGGKVPVIVQWGRP